MGWWKGPSLRAQGRRPRSLEKTSVNGPGPCGRGVLPPHGPLILTKRTLVWAECPANGTSLVEGGNNNGYRIPPNDVQKKEG